MNIMKLIVPVSAFIVLAGCGDENYKNGVEAFGYTQYNKAYKAFSQVDSTSGKYDKVTEYMQTISTKLDSTEYDKLKMAVRIDRDVKFFEESLLKIEERQKWKSPYYDSVQVIREKMANAVTDTIQPKFRFLPNLKVSEMHTFCENQNFEKVNEKNYSSADFFATFIKREIDIFDKRYDLNQVKINSSGWMETQYEKYVNKVKVKCLILSKDDLVGKVHFGVYYNDKPPVAAAVTAKQLPILPDALFENESIRKNMLKALKKEENLEYTSDLTKVKYGFYAAGFPGHFIMELDPFGYDRYRR